MTATTADGTATASRSRLKYRPHLDGLRAVAVALVVAFHVGFERFRGGFIGVDVFFVLSGFLVTRILLDDLTEQDRVRGRQFYARRARRILPAALATLVITALAYAVVATPAERLNALDDFRAAFLYVANWHFVHQSTSYFAPSVTSSPVLHFWSLAVEEQFYLLWPLVLGALWVVARRIGRGRWWVLRGVIFLAALASALAAVHIGATNIDRAYYGTDTRAYQLFAGAVLALTPQLFRVGRFGGRAGRWGATVSLAGLVVAASSALDVSAITRGLIATALAVTLIVLLENARGGFVALALSSGPFVYLGRISYGIYLWHWPIIVLALHGRDLNPLALFVITSALSTALAALSFHLLEHPIRMWRSLDRFKTQVIAIGLALSVSGGVLLMPSILDAGNTSIAGDTTGQPRSGPRLLDWRVAEWDIPALPDCLRQPVDRCTVVHGHGIRVLLMGDSNARMWIPTFRKIAKRQSWTFSVAAFPDCPWQRDLEYAAKPEFVARCRAHQTAWYESVLPKLDPDVIVLAHQTFDDPAFLSPMIGPDGKLLPPDAPDRDKTFADASDAALRALHRDDRRVVILEPIPHAPVFRDPLNCLSQGGDWSRCRYEANRVPTSLELHYRSYARDHSDYAVSLDLDRLVCPRWPTCDPVVGDIIVKRDTTHLTATFALSLAGSVERRLVRAGILAK